jgi:isopenicillin-N N-acyltransferase like protein
VNEVVGGLPVVRVRGSARERGRAVGEALADRIHLSLAGTADWLGARGRTVDTLPTLLGPYLEAARASHPGPVAEIEGMAEGAGAPWWEVFAASAFEELEQLIEPSRSAAPSRCSAFAVHRDGRTWLGHDEQWVAADTATSAVVVAVPDDGPAFASPTVASCLPAVGINAVGVAQAIMSLTADDDGVGTPRVLVSRAGLQAGDPDDAVARATPPGRAGGYAHLFAFANGEHMTVETTATDHAVVRGDCHTNHYLDERLAARSRAGKASKGRLAALEEEVAGRSFDGPEDVREALAIHRGDPEHVCRHPIERDGDEPVAVIFAMACDPANRRLLVRSGTPCTAPFEEVDLTKEFAT